MDGRPERAERAELPFANRTDAGERLAARLLELGTPSDSIVLALPRGGVVVGAAIAKLLKLPFDVLVVRKLGVPWHTELAMGAIARDSQILDRNIIEELGVSEEEIEKVVAAETIELDRREQLYRYGLPELSLAARNVIVVDDGLATGSTMAAAVRRIRNERARRIAVAVPVAAAEPARMIGRLADDVICLYMPEPFAAVGSWYRDFRQVSDEEVSRLLANGQEAQKTRL